MTRRKIRKSPAPKVDSSDSLKINLNSKRLKESPVEKFIKENDESDKLLIGDDEVKPNIELNSVQLKKNLCDMSVQRVLMEMGKDMQLMPPLKIMDKEVYAMTTDSETKEKDDNEMKTLLLQQGCTKRFLKLERNYENESGKWVNAKMTQKGHIKQYTFVETRYYIRPISPKKTYQQRPRLDFPLIKLANALTTFKLPSSKWSYKVILSKVPASILQWHAITMFSGDLTKYQIPEIDRPKYQPSYVTFRREGTSQTHMPYDRTIVFNKSSYSISYDGKRIQFDGAPDAVTDKEDVERLLDLVDSILLSNPMIQIVTPSM